MGNKWKATREQKDKFVPMINEFIEKMKENPDATADIDFYNQGISPTQLRDILTDELGFEEKAFDTNGWEWDFWITMSKDGIDYMIAGTGMTFELVFRLA